MGNYGVDYFPKYGEDEVLNEAGENPLLEQVDPLLMSYLEGLQALTDEDLHQIDEYDVEPRDDLQDMQPDKRQDMWKFRGGKRADLWKFRGGKRQPLWKFRGGKRASLWKFRGGKRGNLWKFRGGKRNDYGKYLEYQCIYETSYNFYDFNLTEIYIIQATIN